ncbi:hypothetical protein PM082_024437 [Marasmius tenuissimus]|nr:hypothetical protein PM082_024437 [Marasmius tenuissimus]
MLYPTQAIFDRQTAQALELQELLDEHMFVQESDGENYHVFAVTKSVPFGATALRRVKVSIDIPIGPVILQLRGWINVLTLECEIQVYIKYPLPVESIKIGEFTGTLTLDGIKINVKSPKFNGWIRIYVKDFWLCISFDLIVFGNEFKGDIKIAPIFGPNEAALAALQVNNNAVNNVLANSVQELKIEAPA